MQPYDNANAAKRKYKNTELYLLPPALFPVHPLDTIDQRYLDSEHSPVVNPHMRSMKVELYNDKWLQGKGAITPTSSTIIDKPSSVFDHAAFAKHPDTSYPRTHDLHIASDTTPDTIENNPITKITPLRQHSSPPTDSFTNDLRTSSDNLFFIAYTPSSTMTC